METTTASGQSEPDQPTGRILVVRVGALGDTLMATPTARALRSVHAGARIDFLASAAAAPLLRRNPDIDRVHVLKGRNIPFWLSVEKRRLARRLGQTGYSFAVLLESAPRYRVLLERAGLTEIRGFRETPFDPDLHSAANNIRAAGLDWTQFPLEPEVVVDTRDRETARRLLADLEPPVVGLHAGYGPARKKKNQTERLKGWSALQFIRLGGMLVEAGASVVLTGSAEDRAEAERIAAALPDRRVRVLAGRTTLDELAGVLAEIRLLVSVDSGPAHLAAAVGTPLVVLWGPAKLQQVRPLSRTAPVTVVRRSVPCAPCYDTPAMKSCRRNICMQLITPASVMKEVRELW